MLVKLFKNIEHKEQMNAINKSYGQHHLVDFELKENTEYELTPNNTEFPDGIIYQDITGNSFIKIV
jgi:hypothetical protein